MNLFKSRLAKLEAFLNTKVEERTPEMLAAAQAEQDALTNGVILVPKSDTVKSAADLQNHIDGLEKAAKEAKASETTAKAEAEKATKALADLRGSRVIDDPRHTSDKGEGGDVDKKTEEERKAQVNNPDAPWNAMADRMGFPAEEPKA